MQKFLAIGDTHQKVRQVRAVISNSKPNPKKLFMSEGIKMHYDLLNANAKIESLFVCFSLLKSEEAALLVEKLKPLCENLFEVSAKTMAKMSEKDSPDGLLSLVYLNMRDANEYKANNKSVVLVLDGVEIPGNIGTMIRMADGAGVQAIFVCNRKARLSHVKVIRASQGAILTMPIYEFEKTEDLINFLQKHNYTVFLADSRAESKYFDTNFANKTAIVVGSERYGITKVWYDGVHKKTSIPMMGGQDSLNVATAATVLVYAASAKLKIFE